MFIISDSNRETKIINEIIKTEPAFLIEETPVIDISVSLLYSIYHDFNSELHVFESMNYINYFEQHLKKLKLNNTKETKDILTIIDLFNNDLISNKAFPFYHKYGIVIFSCNLNGLVEKQLIPSMKIYE